MATSTAQGGGMGLQMEVVSEWLLTSGLRIALILVIMYVSMRVARFIAGRIFTIFTAQDCSEIKKRAETFTSIIRILMTIGIVAVGGVSILSELGVEIGPVLAAAGVVGLAVGFGAQHLVQDVISGFFLLLEDQIRVGDVVEVAGKNGLVERLTPRTVVLRGGDGSVHFVRAGQINIVTNMTKDFSRYVLDVGVAYREDVDRVMAVLRGIDAELRADPKFGPDIIEPIEMLGVDRFADSAVVIRARLATRPGRQWAVGREFNRRLKRRFDAEGIEIPFPHVTVHMGHGGQADALPLPAQAKAGKGESAA